jgi:hypothetical protein
VKDFLLGCIAAAGLLSLMIVIAFASGCASLGLYQMSDEWCASHPGAPASRCASAALAKSTTHCQYGEHPGDPACRKAQSWDQENLKQFDRGCPRSIYIAPNGNLEQCL